MLIPRPFSGWQVRYPLVKVAAFTVAFEGRNLMKAEARDTCTAAHAGAGFHPVRVNNADFAGLFSDAVWHGEMVHYNAHGVAAMP